MSADSLYQQLRGQLAYLRLAAAAEALPSELDHAVKNKLGPSAFLTRLLEVEVAATEQRRHAGLERFARLPAPWRIDDFDFDAQPAVDQTMVRELATLRFLDDATNVLFIGPPGVGKTMLAVALGRASIDAGYRTYYTTAAELAARCHRAALEGRWATTMRFYAGPRLLIIDEVGYLPMAGEAAAALFQVITQRYLKASICLTTNLGVGSWGPSSTTPWSPPPCSTGSCTDPSCSTSTATATACAPTAPEPNAYDPREGGDAPTTLTTVTHTEDLNWRISVSDSGEFRRAPSHRLFAQITRILDINNLSTITTEVVDTARQNLVIGLP